MATGSRVKSKARRLEKLREVHRHLDKQVIKEYNRYQDVSVMKHEKLKLKDEITRLEKEVEDGKLL
tara:strand:+ start:605 stop:802 length:198 start_codon:yes stop_codon:yes gene_type:complete